MKTKLKLAEGDQTRGGHLELGKEVTIGSSKSYLRWELVHNKLLGWIVRKIGYSNGREFHFLSHPQNASRNVIQAEQNPFNLLKLCKVERRRELRYHL